MRRRDWGLGWGLGLLTPWGWHGPVLAKAQAEVQAKAHAEGAGPSPDHALVQLASVWPAGRSPEGFLVSEKLDGVRAVWDGQVLRFRSGRPMAAPGWFVQALPGTALDGELWLGRGQFDRLSGTVRQAQPQDALWRSVRYQVFDRPEAAIPFAERALRLQTVVSQAACPWLAAVAQSTVASALALQTRLEDTVKLGGEGLVLHRADALWQPGRTQALFKFKPEPDEEGRVVGHEAGKGRLAGLTGALRVQTPDGLQFALGTGLSDAQRRNPPPVGAWVTYRYRDRTPSGLPRFASFVRVREAE